MIDFILNSLGYAIVLSYVHVNNGWEVALLLIGFILIQLNSSEE